jgi:hypothetical protein
VSVDFLTTADVAAVLRVTPRTVERWRFHGAGPPFVRVGKRTIRYSRAAVLAFAELYTVRAAAPDPDPRQLSLLERRPS